MGHYGSLTPKLHVGYSNSPKIGRLSKGKFCRSTFIQSLKARGLKQPRTSKKYVDKRGRKKFSGTKALSSTQHESKSFLSYVFCRAHSCCAKLLRSKAL